MMGLYFPDAEMPENCAECPVVKRFGPQLVFASFYCGVKNLPAIPYSEAMKGRRRECPAQEIVLIGYDLTEGGNNDEPA